MQLSIVYIHPELCKNDNMGMSMSPELAGLLLSTWAPDVTRLVGAFEGLHLHK